MGFLLGEAGVRNVSALARGHAFFALWRDELLFRPKLVQHLPVTGVEIFEQLRETGRGVLLSFVHHGHFAGLFPSFAARGVRMHVAAAPHYLDDSINTSRSFGTVRDRAHITTVRGNGNSAFLAGGSYDLMRDLLVRGEVVALAHDLPGGSPATWLGRKVSFASGLPRLALDTGAAIVPVSASPTGPQGLLTQFRAQDPIEPRDHPSVSELLGEIVARHQSSVLDWPEAVDIPLHRCYVTSPEDAERFGVPLPPPKRRG